MGAIGALTLVVEPALGPREFEHGGEQLLLSTAGDQTLAEIMQHGMREAGIVQGQVKGIFPVNAQGNRLSGLAVGEVFNGLEHTDQGQTPRRQGDLSDGGKEWSKLGITEERAK